MILFVRRKKIFLHRTPENAKHQGLMLRSYLALRKHPYIQKIPARELPGNPQNTAIYHSEPKTMLDNSATYPSDCKGNSPVFDCLIKNRKHHKLILQPTRTCSGILLITIPNVKLSSHCGVSSTEVHHALLLHVRIAQPIA